MNNPRGELLLAVIGVDALLDDTPIRLTADKRKEATALPRTIRTEMRRFLEAEEFDRESPLPEFSYRKSLELLTKAPNAEQLAEHLRGFRDDDEALSFAAAAAGAVQYLNQVIPKRARITPTGPKEDMPNGQDISRYRRAHAVLQRPLYVLDELNEGILTSDQVKALAAVFPSIYQAMRDAVITQLAAVVAAKGQKFELPRGKDRQLQVLLQTTTWNKALAADMQRNFSKASAAEPTPQAPQGGQLSINVDSTQTPTDRVAAK